MITVALSQLLDRGVDLNVGEAIAIVQSLASGGGVPSLDTVEIGSDGVARCMTQQGSPTVESLSTLLSTLLPATGVPAALRYAIARGRGEVVAPPFESVAAFSAVLARFETGDCAAIIRALITRARPAPVPAVAVADVPHVPRARRAHLRPAFAAVALAVSAAAGFAGGEFLRTRAAMPARTPAPPVTRKAPPAPKPFTDVKVQGTSGQQPATAPRQRTGPEPKSHPTGPERALGARDIPAFSPSFAPTGTAMFFQTGGAHDRASAIAVASADEWPSADLRIMTVIDDGARNYHAQPSPDGALVAFDSDRDGERGVYVADRDGSHVHRVSGPGYAALPSWAPDGRSLAIVRAEPSSSTVWNLWLQPLDGRPARRLTGYRYGQTWSASWFPDGRRIAYSHEDALTILDVTTGRERRIASPLRGRLVRTPAVSPDGSRIVFQVYRAGAWMLDLRSGSMTCVLADPTAEEFAWAPDGRRFAFHSRRDGQWGVYLVSAAPAAP